MALNNKRQLFIILLSIVLLLSLLRLGTWMMRFSRESLQMDLSAFYTAGEALNHNLSPYLNHAARDPAIWDGIDRFQHSRFLYPPQVAVLFRPLAWLSYAAAKRLWMAISLACVAASLVITGGVFGLGRKWILILTAATGTALFYPLLTHLERGQIDAVTLLLITLASAGMGRRTPRSEFSAGLLLCAATLLKLHCVYMLPFVLLRKKGRVLLGYLGGGVLIAALTAITPGGIANTLGYVRDELPRISRFGEWGTDDMRLPKEVLVRQKRGLPEGATIKDEIVYQPESFRFTANGTLVRVIKTPLQEAKIWVSSSLLSALTLGLLFAGIVAWQARLSGPLQVDERGEILYWHMVTLVVLLAAPLTWVMNLVWIVPLFVALPAEIARDSLARAGQRQSKLVLALGIAALVIIALPDGVGHPLIGPNWANMISHKYVIGEGLLLLSLLGYIPAPAR